MRKIMHAAIAALVVVGMVGCDSGNKKPAEEQPTAKPEAANQEESEYLTGRTAFQKLFVAARGFAPDVKAYRLTSTYTEGAPATEGKAALWRGEFASPGRRSIKAYMWSGLAGPDAPERGVTHSTEDTYNPSNTTINPFELPFLKVDTDQAFQVAQKNGGEKLTKANPKQPVFYTLDFNPRASQLVWHVIYGSSMNDAQLRIAVDASTGQFIRKER